MKKKPTYEDSGEELREYASPPCMAHEFEVEILSIPETIVFLNELVESERAGTQGILEMVKRVEEESSKELLRELAKDEARFCSMLSHHVERLGGMPNRATGAFAEKLAKREPFSAKVTLLDRGQSVVVKMLDEAIPKMVDARLTQDLIEMRDVHRVNIRRANSLSPESDTTR